jgi:hypothetical protein
MSEPHGNSSEGHAAAPPEPKTPMWLPALGAVLFLTVGILWGLRPSADGDTGAAQGAAGAASAAPAGADAGAARH